MKGLFWVEAEGVCMWPSVREGDLLLCQPLDASLPPMGELLVAREGTRFVAHRLQRSYGLAGREHFVLKADLGQADRPRPRHEIVGRVLLVYRSEGALVDVGPPLAAEPDLGPIGAALLRRVARWHGVAAQTVKAVRNHLPAPLEFPDGPTA